MVPEKSVAALDVVELVSVACRLSLVHGSCAHGVHSEVADLMLLVALGSVLGGVVLVVVAVVRVCVLGGEDFRRGCAANSS